MNARFIRRRKAAVEQTVRPDQCPALSPIHRHNCGALAGQLRHYAKKTIIHSAMKVNNVAHGCIWYNVSHEYLIG